jgi:hypothetical protein
VNWAKATTFIAHVKAWREEARMIKSGFMEYSKKGIGEGLGKIRM